LKFQTRDRLVGKIDSSLRHHERDLGFPPFLGGPFRHLDTLGASTVVQQLDALNTRFPGRFEPAAM
jgi:3-hydroxyacyl-CoA dehydrogenase/enoyl-CoA hydratase/3-hydroxybutyryl-CoA epimerase